MAQQAFDRSLREFLNAAGYDNLTDSQIHVLNDELSKADPRAVTPDVTAIVINKLERS